MSEKEGIDLQIFIKVYEAEEYDEAIALGKRFTKKFPGSGTGLNVLGLSYKASGNIPEAIKIFKSLVKALPKSAIYRSNLGNTYMLIGRIREAISCFKQAIKRDPKLINAIEALGLAFLEVDREAAALKCFKRVIQLDPDNQRTLYYIGNMHLNNLNWISAGEHLKRSSFGLSQSHYLECLLSLGKGAEFVDFYTKLTDSGITNPLIGGLVAHAEELYGKRLNNSFCNNSLDHIYVGRVEEQHGFTDKLAGELIDYHHGSKNDYRSQALLQFGTQSSGNLFLVNEPFVKSLEACIENQIDHYREKFKDSDQGFLKNWPEQYKLFGWMVSIKSGGNLNSHNHKEGWLSGSYYLSLPERSEEGKDDGKIAFSYRGPRYPAIDKPIYKEVMDIKKRDICMFPSSLFHETIPFDGTEERISFAFDVIPTR